MKIQENTRKIYENTRKYQEYIRKYKKNNTYKGKLPKIYAGQMSKIHEKAAFLYISDFLVR